MNISYLDFDLKPAVFGCLTNALAPLLNALESCYDRASHCSGSCIFGYNSAPVAAREVFKPSTDSSSLIVSSQKKNFQFWFRGSFGGVSQVGVSLRFYGLL